MTKLVFVDTNVLVYARDRRDVAKRDRATAWLSYMGERECMRLNLQVLNELTRWLTGQRPARPMSEIRDEVEVLHHWGTEPTGLDEIETAWTVREQFGFQWFDCLLIAAANRIGCHFFLTEDMVDGARCGSVTLVNPFRTTPSELLHSH